MEVHLVIQMGSLVQMWRLVEQVSLVQERVSPQWAHPAVAQDGLWRSFTHPIHAQADGRSGHDGGLNTRAQRPEAKRTLALAKPEEEAEQASSPLFL